MPSQADRLLRIALDQIEKLGRRIDRLMRLLADRVDNIEDQLATIEQRLTDAGHPRDMRPPDRRTPGQREAAEIQDRFDHPDDAA